SKVLILFTLILAARGMISHQKNIGCEMQQIDRRLTLRALWKNKSHDKGASAVEFAMLIYPLSFILMGVINFGYALFGFNQIQAMANETVRAISYNALSDAEAKNVLATKLARFGGSSLSIEVDNSGPQSRTITISGTTDHLTLVDFPFASFQYYQPSFAITSTAPTFKMSSVAAGS
ncbi:MAG: TadE family protein, partial [Pseudomonadota bacterium]